MDNTFSQLITTFILTGGIGFINYFLLSKMDKITINKNEKEDKVLIILFFTIVNYTIYLIIKSFVIKEATNSSATLIEGISIGLTLFITLICSLTVFPLLINLTGKFIDFTRKNVQHKSVKHNFSPKSKAFDKNKAQEVFIFTLDYINGKRNYVSNGFMSDWSTIDEYQNQLTLTPSSFEGIYNDYTEDDIVKQMNTAQDNGHDTLIYIDINQKLIYYIIYHENIATSEVVSEKLDEFV